MGWQKFMLDENFSPQQGVAWYEIFKKDVAFRTANISKLNVVFAKSTLRLTPYEWCFILQASGGINVALNYANSMPSITSSTDLLEACESAKAKVDVEKENKPTNRNFFRIDWFAPKIAWHANYAYTTSFMEDAQEAFVFSGFGLVFKKDAFQIFIKEIAQHPANYDEGATNTVIDFLRRFHREEETDATWRSLAGLILESKGTDHLNMHCNQVLYTMETYEQGACDLFASVLSMVKPSVRGQIRVPLDNLATSLFRTNSQLRSCTKVQLTTPVLFFRLWKVKHMARHWRRARTLLQQRQGEPVFDALKEAFFSHLRIWFSWNWTDGVMGLTRAFNDSYFALIHMQTTATSKISGCESASTFKRTRCLHGSSHTAATGQIYTKKIAAYADNSIVRPYLNNKTFWYQTAWGGCICSGCYVSSLCAKTDMQILAPVCNSGSKILELKSLTNWKTCRCDPRYFQCRPLTPYTN